MYARLWWKDTRQFWPIWGFLLVAAYATLALLARYADTTLRSGGMVPIALSFAWLYGVAVAATAFAGERENGTLRFLDVLPVDRWILWKSKVGFGLVTMLALAILVAVPALLVAIGSPVPKNAGSDSSSSWMPLAYLVILLEGLGWGLLASALSKNALTASLAAATCSAFSLSPIFMNYEMVASADIAVRSIPWRLLAIVGTTAASAVIMVRSQMHRGGRSLAAQSGRAAAKGWRFLRTPVVLQSPFALPQARSAVMVPPRRLWAWWPEIRSIFWLSFRQNWKLWALAIIVGLGIPLFLSQVLLTGVIDSAIFALLGLAILINVGINTFGAENRNGMQRFLANHGARPWLVWTTKLSGWFLLAALLTGYVIVVSYRIALLPHLTRSATMPLVMAGVTGWLAIAICAISAGIFCGMVIRRSITAWVVALLMICILVLPQGVLLSAGLISPYALPITPFALVFLTWTWRKDWMYDRPAPGRWIRLGAWSTATFAVMLGWYISDRAWGIAETPPIAPPAQWSAAQVPANRNAGLIYEEVATRGVPDTQEMRYLADAWTANPRKFERFKQEIESRPEVYENLRKATMLPDCRIVTDPEKMTQFMVMMKYIPFTAYAQIFAFHAGELGREGDLAGAWSDIEAIFRMTRQMGQDLIGFQNYWRLEIDRQNLGLAMEWAADPRQKPEVLRAALKSFQALPPMVSPRDVIRAEAYLVERTLDLPREDLRRHLGDRFLSRKQDQTMWNALHVDATSTPWEIERARRANRQRFNAMLEANPEPSRRPLGNAELYRWGENPFEREAQMLFQLSPSAWSYVDQDDQCEVGRRALVQILALRIWQTEHGGKLPHSLNELVPGILPKLPDDPYNSNKPFVYVPSDGRLVPKLGSALLMRNQSMTLYTMPTPGYWLLYSVGINRFDNQGQFITGMPQSSENDIIFAIKDDVKSGGGGAAGEVSKALGVASRTP